MSAATVCSDRDCCRLSRSTVAASAVIGEMGSDAKFYVNWMFTRGTAGDKSTASGMVEQSQPQRLLGISGLHSSKSASNIVCVVDRDCRGEVLHAAAGRHDQGAAERGGLGLHHLRGRADSRLCAPKSFLALYTKPSRALWQLLDSGVDAFVVAGFRKHIELFKSGNEGRSERLRKLIKERPRAFQNPAHSSAVWGLCLHGVRGTGFTGDRVQPTQ